MAGAQNGGHLRKQDMHRFDVIAELKKRGHTLKGLSQEHGYASNEFARTLANPPINHNVALIVSAVIEKPLHAIWPSRYTVDGTIIGYGTRQNPSAATRRRKGLRTSAA
jgi:lambda repressor-like predicted transcriptional regulator